jgi:hypothetical protein
MFISTKYRCRGGGRLPDDRDKQRRAGAVATREDRGRPRVSGPPSAGRPTTSTDILSLERRHERGRRPIPTVGERSSFVSVGGGVRVRWATACGHGARRHAVGARNEMSRSGGPTHAG